MSLAEADDEAERRDEIRYPLAHALRKAEKDDKWVKRMSTVLALIIIAIVVYWIFRS